MVSTQRHFKFGVCVIQRSNSFPKLCLQNVDGNTSQIFLLETIVVTPAALLSTYCYYFKKESLTKFFS